MTVFEQVKKLTKSRSKTMKQVTTDLGYSENYFYSLKSGKQPTAERLSEIADYFNVSTDYLLGRTDEPKIADKTKVTDADLDDVLDGVMSYKGGPLTEKDREAVRIFLEGRKSK